MLAVVPMDAGRSCGLLSTNGSIMDAARAWVPHASPAAYVGADRQTASPITPNLPGPRGSLAARRRQTQAPHRRHGRNVARESNGAWKTTSGGGSGGGGAGGGAVHLQATSSEGRERRRPVRRDNGTVAVSSNSSRRRSQDQRAAPVVEEASGSARSLRRSRGRGSSSGSGGAGGGARGAHGCGEAWGADTTVATVRTPSDRGHSGGTCSGRGGAGSSGAEVWAWAGPGGGAARGKAMLSAYGLQTDKNSPACSRGNAGDGAVRHGRWQRDHDGGGARKGDDGGGAGDEDGREAAGEGEGDTAAGRTTQGAGRRRGSGGCRGSDRSYDGESAGQASKFRGGKVRQKRPSAAAPHGSSTGAVRRSSRDSHEGFTAEGIPGGVDQTSAPTIAAPEVPRQAPNGVSIEASGAAASPEEETPSSQTDDPRSADRIQRALEDLLVPRRGSTASPHPSCCSGTTLGAEAGPPAAAATTTTEHVAVLTMDGRGGSAAPPYRPQLSLKVPASASHASVLPDLGTAIGVGAPRGGGGVAAAFQADSGTDSSVVCYGEEGGEGGDDHSTPPVSRQRSHSHHSPWQARKHPRGFSRGRGGAGFGRHHRHHPHNNPAQERSLLEERPSSGSTAGRLGSCFSSESPERAPPVFSSPSAASTLVVSEVPQHTAGNVCVVAPAAAARGQHGSNPFDRLLHPHHHGDEPSSPYGGGGGTAVVTASPRCDLIDHFKLATRPTSRRGSRKQGDMEGGGECTPEPAFCLFSRGGVGGGAAGRSRDSEDDERRRRSGAKEFDRH